MALILNGKIVGSEIAQELKKKLENISGAPTLVILQVGERSDSDAYIRQKKKFADIIGAKIIHKVFSESVTQEEILQHIELYNADMTVHGILLQIPLPAQLDKDTLIEAIIPIKDVDGLMSRNTQLLWDGKKGGHMPATTRGILSLLAYYHIPVEGKNITVVGKSTLVGKPTALALLNLGGTVTICHKQTVHLETYTKQAEILIVAIGDPEFITRDFISSGQVIIDVGINQVEEAAKKILGDVKKSEIEDIVAAITPVPGGVGPMTVASLFQNLYDAYTQLS